ncbi:MAG: hypothetical protein LBS55_08480 [Prevotellaceae bacterium]|nr:hypothetical protein [Prevotellaceae bacterium]
MIIIIALIFIVLQLSANNDDDKISAFEKKIAATFSSDEKDVKLIGCKIFEIDSEFRDEFKTSMEAHKEELEKSTYFAEDYSYSRMYFPINSAIIDCNGVQYAANEKGIVSLPDSCDISKIKVIGLKKSDHLTGSPIRDTLPDRILFDPELIQGVNNDGVKTGYSHKKEKICVFIFFKGGGPM